jgi:hypothetical protein
MHRNKKIGAQTNKDTRKMSIVFCTALSQARASKDSKIRQLATQFGSHKYDNRKACNL